jgi:hypothetical protein
MADLGEDKKGDEEKGDHINLKVKDQVRRRALQLSV